MLQAADFFIKYSEELGLQFICGKQGSKKKIKSREVERPGLALAGFLKNFSPGRMLIFGRTDMEYLSALTPKQRLACLSPLITAQTPAIVVCFDIEVLPELKQMAEEKATALFLSSLTTSDLLSKLTRILDEEFVEQTSCHGTFLEAFDLGVLIQGESSIGKSETALGLIERGHCLISDDLVKLKLRRGPYLEGSGTQLNRHLIEIRGIGIINVAHLYGAGCVIDSKRLDLIVKLEEWNPQMFYDRVGLEEKHVALLGLNIPYYVLPVKPGRDIVLLIEAIVLNHRLKLMGQHAPKEFNKKLLEAILQKQKKRSGQQVLDEAIAKSKN